MRYATLYERYEYKEYIMQIQRIHHTDINQEITQDNTIGNTQGNTYN